MFDVKEAVRVLRQLRCNNHFETKDVYEYHTCLNVIEDALCDKDYVMIDLSSFNTDSPEECYNAIKAANNRETYF